MQKIHDRRAFAQKLGVRDHVEALRIHAMAVQHAPDPVVGVDRNRALLHDHLVAVDGAGNLCHHGLDVGQVGGAAVALRRAHGDEHGLALLHGLAQIGGEGHALPRCLASSSGRCSSKMGTPPSRSSFTLASSLSTQMTWWPISAKQAAATSPT